jgi:4-amino-4-deoxy-L-arabinose transferase-like glycosyltransferase
VGDAGDLGARKTAGELKAASHEPELCTDNEVEVVNNVNSDRNPPERATIPASEPNAGAPDRIRALIALICVFAFALLLRTQIAAMPLDRDEGEYAYTSSRWLNGDVPYKDAFDQKPPGVFAVYAVIQTLGGGSPEAFHWATQIYTLGTITCVFYLGWKLYSLPAGVCAAALFAFMVSNACVMGNSSNTELFMILPMTAAFWTALLAVQFDSPKWGLITGLLAMLALLFKQVALPPFLFSALYLLLFCQRRWLITSVFLAGSSGLLLCVCVYFFARDSLYQFYDCTIGFNLHYSARVEFSDYPICFWDSFGRILQVNWVSILFAAVGIIGCLWSNLRRGCWQAGREELAMVAWFICCVLGLSIGGQFREHYYVQALPPLALLASRGMTRVRLGKRIAARERAGAFLGCAAAVFLGVRAEYWYYLPASNGLKSARIYGSSPFPESPAIADYLAQHATPEETVYVLGSEPQILFHAHRASASRYFFVQPVLIPTALAPGSDRLRQHEILDALRARPPKFIVTVFIRSSMVCFPETPLDIFEGVRVMANQSYHVVGLVPAGEVGRRKLIAGPLAARLWEQAPFWYDIDPDAWWSIIVLWERNEPAPKTPAIARRGQALPKPE